MNRKFLLAGLAAMTIASSAYAIPAFARQTGMSCSACHFQHFPILNQMGRSFKAGGYTMNGAQGLIEGDNLSIPQALNAGLTTKVRYQKSNGPTAADKLANNNGTNSGQIQFPDELLLQIAGRVSENIGFIADLNLIGGAKNVIESVKMPFTYDVAGLNVGVVPFFTGTQGVAYGFELLNTGAVRGQRVIEARSSFSAQQYIGTATMAEGAAFVVSNPLFFANVTKWSPRDADSTTNGNPSATYGRLAFTPCVGDWNLAAGVQYWTGSATEDVNATTGVTVDTKAISFDAQAQGSIGTMPLGIYFSHAKADASPLVGNANLFNANPRDKTATAVLAELGVIPEQATVSLGYRSGDNGAAINSDDNSVVVGATYQLAMNVQLHFNHEMYSGNAKNSATGNGDRLTTFMLFAAF